MGNWEQCSMIFTPATGYEGVFNLYFAGPDASHFAKLKPSYLFFTGRRMPDVLSPLLY
jgi:hypothetical protein